MVLCFRKGGDVDLQHVRFLGGELFGQQPKGRVMQMQVPWFKPAAWGVVVGAIGTMIIGFSWLGWTLGSTAERMATERTSAALVVALTPSCVARFMQQPGAAAKLAEFQKIESWNQRQFIEAGGWATPRNGKEPNSGVATACAEELAKTKT